MAINPGDLQISLDASQMQGVLGRNMIFSILVSNYSTTDTLYNLKLKLTLPDGLSFVSSDKPYSSVTETSSYEEDVLFLNVKDLAPNEVDYKIEFTINADNAYRQNGALVPFNTLVSGLKIEGTVDSKPRGSYDSGNITINAIVTSSFRVLRYSAKFTLPESYLKGAGTIVGDISNVTQSFDFKITLINNTRSMSTISLTISLANGLRYIGSWQTSGTNSANFTNPLVSNVTSSKDYVTIYFNNKNLSAGSETDLMFKAAIWDKYTVLGIENSGSTIYQGDMLLNNILISGETLSYYGEASLEALEVLITKSCDNEETDVGVTNHFDLSYTLSEYLPLNNVILTDILPDGLQYNGVTSLPFTSLVNNSDGTTTITWNLGNLGAQMTGTINFEAITASTYINGDDVVSIDVLTNNFSINAIRSDSTTLAWSVSYSLYVAIPIIIKEVLAYYYEDLTPKPFDVATIGDIIEFKIIYDATEVAAKQKNVHLFDYPPLNMIMTTFPIPVSITGNLPSAIATYLLPDNGAGVDFGNINGYTYGEIIFRLKVTDENVPSFNYNLAKIQMEATNGIRRSFRDRAIMFFGNPDLKLSNSISGYSCARYNENYAYTIDILNHADLGEYVTDAFNNVLVVTIPNIFTVESTSIINTNSVNEPVFIDNNVLTMNIDKISPYGELSLTINALSTSKPIMKVPYTFDTFLSQGTSQPSESSHAYTLNDSATIASTIMGCSPSISKVYDPTIVKLGDIYKSTVTVTFPSGVIAYNTKIKDSLLSTNSSNLTNVKLNDATIPYNVVTNNLIIPLEDTLDTSSGEIAYKLTFNDKVLTANPVNYQDIRHVSASTDWSDVLGYPETYSQVASATITIVVPGVVIEKYQSNQTRNYAYDKKEIMGVDYDTILFKLTLHNVGKAPAYDIQILDTIPNTLQLMDYTNATGTFNPVTRELNLDVATLDVNEYKDVIIETRIINDGVNPIALNSASLGFKANPTFTNNYGSANSNITRLLKDTIVITKLQKNITLGGDFTTNSLNVINGQSIQYKVTVTNSSLIAMTNISIEDTFPDVLTFISFEPFVGGTLSRSNNNISCTIYSLQPGATVTFVYNLRLDVETLSRESSLATMYFNYIGGINTFTEYSNLLYTVFSAPGKGFMIY